MYKMYSTLNGLAAWGALTSRAMLSRGKLCHGSGDVNLDVCARRASLGLASGADSIEDSSILAGSVPGGVQFNLN